MRLVLLAAATAIISTPAVAAQGKTYSLSKAEARQAMQDYVACSVKAAPDLASKAVIEDWGTEQIVGDGSALLTPGCTKAAGFIAQLRFQPEIFRGMMAEQLALRGHHATRIQRCDDLRRRSCAQLLTTRRTRAVWCIVTSRAPFLVDSRAVRGGLPLAVDRARALSVAPAFVGAGSAGSQDNH